MYSLGKRGRRGHLVIRTDNAGRRQIVGLLIKEETVWQKAYRFEPRVEYGEEPLQFDHRTMAEAIRALEDPLRAFPTAQREGG